jgi:hypothetical protein
MFGEGGDMEQGMFGKGASGFSQMFKGSSNPSLLGRFGGPNPIPPNGNSPIF